MGSRYGSADCGTRAGARHPMTKRARRDVPQPPPVTWGELLHWAGWTRDLGARLGSSSMPFIATYIEALYRHVERGERIDFDAQLVREMVKIAGAQLKKDQAKRKSRGKPPGSSTPSAPPAP